MLPKDTKPASSGLLGKIIAQLLGFLVCVAAPGLLTAIAPVSWIQYQRVGDHVTARAKTCLLFLIPYRTQSVDPVTGIGQRTKTGSLNRERRGGRETNRYVQAESEGVLQIQGPHHEVEVSVTPADIKSVVEKSEAFLKDPQATELRLFVVANWKFSVIFGGLASLLTGLYAVSWLAALGLFLLRQLGLVRNTTGLLRRNSPGGGDIP